MTNITGKIYQMQNAAGTENRFPRTVIEAVLGLSSYLQDQFSALADIYMPIEGISEALTGQEFVYRKSPNTIKAKSLTLDRIKGKTLAWNQLVPLDYFGTATYGTLTITNNGDGTYTLNGSATSDLYIQPTGAHHSVVSGHKYFISEKRSASGVTYIISDSSLLGGNKGRTVFSALGSGVVASEYIYITSGSSFSNAKIAPMLIDLTLETLADQISAPADFEALYPGIYPYNPGTLISNDAEAVETTGVNQWDEEWEIGALYSRTGAITPSETTRRTTNYIPIFPNTKYYFRGPAGSGNGRIAYFDADKNCIYYSSVTAPYENTEFTTPEGAYYVRITLGSAYGTTYNHDICINLSDPAKNGTYEPYWKRTLPLDLTTKKDTDGNVPFADGMKDAGTAADWADKVGGEKWMEKIKFSELNWSKSSSVIWAVISNKKPGANTMICSSYVYVADQAFSVEDKKISDSSVSNYATWIFIKDTNYSSSDIAAFLADHGSDEVVYPLATPVPFTWAEPLINTVKAGTTEARISPNSDGLSAPFCCDMTYSASENNDSESAQYAATAGRLLNTRKIWGQDFNGSEDVNGNLVSNGILQGTQLKSTAPTGTAPLVVASSTTVANLVAEKASQLLTARTIWGQNFDGSRNISGAISNITTLSASGLATIAGGIALGTSANAQAAKMSWNEDNNAWHLQGNLYADGFITAGGINQDSVEVDISPYVIDCNNWANSGRGYISQTVFSDAIAKYKAGYQVHSNGYQTTNTYLLTGISETTLELYFNGDSGFTLSVEA